MARRHTTRLPIIITETAYAKAALAAETEGVSLAEYAEAALEVAVARTHAKDREAQYARACRQAAERREITPTRWEFFGARRQPFVRPSATTSGAAKQRGGEPSRRKTVSAQRPAKPDGIPAIGGGKRPDICQTGRITPKSTDIV